MRYNLHLIYKREHEFLLSGAHFLSCSIVSSTKCIAQQFLAGSSPRPYPLKRMSTILFIGWLLELCECIWRLMLYVVLTAPAAKLLPFENVEEKKSAGVPLHTAALKRSSGVLHSCFANFAFCKKVSLTLSVIWSPSLQTAKKMRSKFRQMSTRKPREMESRWQVFGIQKFFKGAKIRGISFEY